MSERKTESNDLPPGFSIRRRASTQTLDLIFYGEGIGLTVSEDLEDEAEGHRHAHAIAKTLAAKDAESKFVGRTWWLHVDGSGRIVSAAATRRGAYVFRPREDGERVIEVAEVQSTEYQSKDSGRLDYGALDAIKGDLESLRDDLLMDGDREKADRLEIAVDMLTRPAATEHQSVDPGSIRPHLDTVGRVIDALGPNVPLDIQFPDEESRPITRAGAPEYPSKDRARKLLDVLKERTEGDIVCEEYLIEVENMLHSFLETGHQSKDPYLNDLQESLEHVAHRIDTAMDLMSEAEAATRRLAETSSTPSTECKSIDPKPLARAVEVGCEVHDWLCRLRGIHSMSKGDRSSLVLEANELAIKMSDEIIRPLDALNSGKEEKP